MGNALMFLLIFVVMSFVAGFALRWFALLFGASGAVIGGIIAFDLVPDSKKYIDRKSTRLNSSHSRKSRMPSSA